MRLVFGHDKLIAQWVANRIDYVPSRPGVFDPCVATGVADGLDMLAGVVYHDYFPDYRTMSISMAADSPRWCTRGVVIGLLAYPFEQMGVNVLWHAVLRDNERMIKLAKGLGFVREGGLKDRFGPGRSAEIFRMQPKEYHRLKSRFAAKSAEADAA